MESQDGGTTFGTMRGTGVPNPDSGLDGTTLSDGRLVLVCNDTTKGRARLSVLVSDDAERFDRVMTLEDDEGEYSYPAVIREDERLHVVYTHRRTAIAHVEIDESTL